MICDLIKCPAVLYNLFVNAIKFSPPTANITINITESEIIYDGLVIDALHFAITAEGAGIPEHELKQNGIHVNTVMIDDEESCRISMELILSGTNTLPYLLIKPHNSSFSFIPTTLALTALAIVLRIIFLLYGFLI